jgi:hypothetical protein
MGLGLGLGLECAPSSTILEILNDQRLGLGLVIGFRLVLG